MANNTREIKRRIKSVKNTKKITKAMELVSAAKMRKSVQRVLATRSYAQVAWQTLMELSQRIDASENPLLAKRETIKNVAVVVIASNRGLCGGFNTNIIKKAAEFIQQREEGVENIDVITLGKKSFKPLARYNFNMKADFEKKDVTASMTDIFDVSNFLLSEYIAGTYDQVVITYTDFESALTQTPRVTTLLPLHLEDADQALGSVEDREGYGEVDELEQEEFEYILEPDPETLLNSIAPKIIEVKLYQAVLESDASEHSARMMAMKNASEAADDMTQSLVFAYNRARQASITQEISEISAGKASLEK
jgi:F-type H+-transporting ATPase subunit gamma